MRIEGLIDRIRDSKQEQWPTDPFRTFLQSTRAAIKSEGFCSAAKSLASHMQVRKGARFPKRLKSGGLQDSQCVNQNNSPDFLPTVTKFKNLEGGCYSKRERTG